MNANELTVVCSGKSYLTCDPPDPKTFRSHLSIGFQFDLLSLRYYFVVLFT